MGIESLGLSVVIPAYNEKDRISATLAEIEDFMEDYPEVVNEIIIVDDGSKDATVERALRFVFKLPLTVESLPENQGKWAAIMHGVECARNDKILLLDADGSASIREVARTKNLGAFQEGRIAIYGSRFAPGATVDGKPFTRTVISSGYRAYVRSLYWWASGKKDVDDMQCPFKMFKKSQLRFPVKTKRFCGDIELACSLRTPIVTHPVHFMHRAGGSIKPTTIWDMAKETLLVAAECRKRISSLKNS